MQQEHVIDVVKATPVAGFIGTQLAGFDWGVASYVVATVYTCFLIGEKLFKWFRAWKDSRASEP